MSEHRTPRDTSRAMQDPAERLLFLADSWGRGPGGFIEAQESAGQREIVHSDVVPVKGCDEDELTALGFTLGEVIDGDPLFRSVTLPDGWKREGSDHAMWSYLLDDLRRRRISIFYKAAFYDRKAHMSVTSVSGYVAHSAYEKQPIVFDDIWATRVAVLAAIDELREADAEKVNFWIQHDNDEYVREYTARVAEWDAYRATVAAVSQDPAVTRTDGEGAQ